jgi:hypothetical protein
MNVCHSIPRSRHSHNLILIRSRTNQLEELIPLADAISGVLEMIEPGQMKTIPLPG